LVDFGPDEQADREVEMAAAAPRAPVYLRKDRRPVGSWSLMVPPEREMRGRSNVLRLGSDVTIRAPGGPVKRSRREARREAPRAPGAGQEEVWSRHGTWDVCSAYDAAHV
jgi:transketolase C-terminal domain/subunit